MSGPRPAPSVAAMHANRRPAVASVALCAAVAAGAAPAFAAPRGWETPVDAAVGRRFTLGANPFAAGSHRGVDFAASPGSAVRAACDGRVTFAGRVAGGAGVVTIACDSWQVTYLPLNAPTVRAGATTAPGMRIGNVGRDPDHAGLHMGVRSAVDRRGYVDPLPFLAFSGPAPGLPAGRFAGRGPRTRRTAERRRPAPRPGQVPTAQVAPAASADRSSPAPRVAPVPVWLGVSLLLAGGVGMRRRRTRRTRRDARGRPRAQEAPATAR